MEFAYLFSRPRRGRFSAPADASLLSFFGKLPFIAGRYPGKPGKTAPTVQTFGFPAAGGD